MRGSLSERFRPRMLALATAAGLLVATLPSAVHGLLSRRDLRRLAQQEATALSARVRVLVEESPALWAWDLGKQARLVDEGRPAHRVGVRLLDGGRRLAWEQVVLDVSAVWAEAPVRDGPRTVAWVQAAVEGGPALRTTLVLHGAFSALGLVLAALLYAIPLRAVRGGERGLVTHAEARARIARELHDGVGQSLTAARVHLQVGSTEAAIRALDLATDELRRAVDELRPAGLDGATLVEALRALAEQVGQAGGLAVEVDLPEPLSPVPPEVELACYRIVQEALSNVVRHAAAAHARVVLAPRRGRLEIEIEDDGVGLGDAPRGAGLSGMADRVAELGGTFAAGPARPRGTRVFATLRVEERE